MTPFLPLPPPAVSATPPIAPSKSFAAAAPTGKLVMDSKVAKRRAEKKGQASETVKQKHWKNERNEKTKTVIE